MQLSRLLYSLKRVDLYPNENNKGYPPKRYSYQQVQIQDNLNDPSEQYTISLLGINGWRDDLKLELLNDNIKKKTDINPKF